MTMLEFNYFVDSDLPFLRLVYGYMRVYIVCLHVIHRLKMYVTYCNFLYFTLPDDVLC